MFLSKADYSRLSGESSSNDASPKAKTASSPITAAALDHHPFTNPDGSAIDVHDNTLLSILDKDHVLTNMKNRFNRDCIYTFTASVLLSVNPYKHISGMYTPEMQMLYTNKSLHSLPPHPYALADTAYRYFQGDSKSQVLVISGESGSGKTETAKVVISFLASHRERRLAKSDGDMLTASRANLIDIHDRVIKATPILEAFGNASTIRNKNSSRFGKYHRLLYDRTGKLNGAEIKPFLLESSRVTGLSKNERNFHIFYLLIAGLPESELNKFGLSRKDNYPVISQGLMWTGEDIEKFTELENAFQIVGFGDSDKESIFKTIAGLMILSQVLFSDPNGGGHTHDNNDSKNNKPIVIVNEEILEKASDLLGMSSGQLTKVLLHKTVKVTNRASTYSVPRTLAQVESTRATLIRTIYKRLFEKIVGHINSLVSGGAAARGENDLHIGILDIFGFENLEKNSFEQLCINLTNEKLQQFFIRKVLESEQKTYQAEGIHTDHNDVMKIPLPDCSETLGCIKGALELLDDHCIRMARNMATDEEKYCVQVHRQFNADKAESKLQVPKMSKANRKNGAKVEPRSKNTDGFVIKHYAGDVCYTVSGWMEKNNERMSPEMECVLRDSENKEWVASLADSDACSYACEKFKSVRSKFMSELDSMLSMLDKCSVHYIRCFNPNNGQRSGDFQTGYVEEQVVQCGTVELVKVMHHGFPNRQPLSMIASNFQSLLPHDFRNLSPRDFASVIMNAFEIPKTEYAIGFTTLFLKADQIRLLEQLRGVGELPSERVLSTIRRQVAEKKLRRCFEVIKLVNWLPKLGKELRRKRLFSHAAALAIRLAFIIPRTRVWVKSARAKIRVRREEEEKLRLEEEERQRKAEEERIRREEEDRRERLRLEEEKRVREAAERNRLEEERLRKMQATASSMRTVPQLAVQKGKENAVTNSYPPVASTASKLAGTATTLGNSLAKLAPVTAKMVSSISLFPIPQMNLLIIYDGQRLMPIATNETVETKSRRSSIGTAVPTVLPSGLRTATVGAIAQHPYRRDVFATTEADEMGAVTIWRATRGIESRFRIHLGSSNSTTPQTTVIQKICFICPDRAETVSPVHNPASHLLAVLVECTTANSMAHYLIFVEVAIGPSRKVSVAGGQKNEESNGLQFKVHKVEPIPPSQFIAPQYRKIAFVKTSASGRIVAIGGKGLLMFFAVGMDNGAIQVDLLAEQSYFPQIQTTTFLSFMSLFNREGPADPDDYEEEQLIVSTADGNMLRFPVLINQITCALDVSGCGKVKECMATLSGKRLTSLVKKSDEAYYSITADGCIDQWVWIDRRPFRDQESSIALVAENSKAMFSTASIMGNEVVCFDASAGKVVAFDPTDPDSLNPRLLYQFNSQGILN